jgi:hypothetical protein
MELLGLISEVEELRRNQASSSQNPLEPEERKQEQPSPQIQSTERVDTQPSEEETDSDPEHHHHHHRQQQQQQQVDNLP